MLFLYHGLNRDQEFKNLVTAASAPRGELCFENYISIAGIGHVSKRSSIVHSCRSCNCSKY